MLEETLSEILGVFGRATSPPRVGVEGVPISPAQFGKGFRRLAPCPAVSTTLQCVVANCAALCAPDSLVASFKTIAAPFWQSQQPQKGFGKFAKAKALPEG